MIGPTGHILKAFHYILQNYYYIIEKHNNFTICDIS
jgi:predicted RNA-binding protein Jag